MWLPDLADPGLMTDLFSRHAEPLGLVDDVATCRLLDARMSHPHRPESPLCSGWATYELSLADTGSRTPILLYVKAFPDGTSREVWMGHCAAVPDTSARHLPTLDLIVWPFPEDPGLPALPSLVDPITAARQLPPLLRAELDGAAIESGGLRIEVVRYQPEKSATLRYGVDRAGSSKSAGAFAKNLAKNHAEDDFAAKARRQFELWSLAERAPGLRIAEPLAADVERGVLWTRAVAGPSMVSALQPERLDAVSCDMAQVLASLHDSGVGVPGHVSVDHCLAEMHKKSDKLALAHPPIARAVSDLVTAADVRRPNVPATRDRTLHGDFHVDQLIDAPDGAVLVDLDSMVRGTPEMDLAEFVVDLSLRDLPEAVVRELVPLLLGAYEGHSGHSLDTGLLRTFADAEFVNRCYRHLRRHAPGWSTSLELELSRHDYVDSLLPS